MPAIKESTGISPLTIITDGTSLLDWRITATEGKLGKLGKNYLKPKFDPIPNGAAGSWLSNTAWIADSLDQGYTFNTGEATIICIEFKHEGDANILPAHIGNLMLVEGSTMPTQYDETTNLFKGTITNGCIAVSTYQDSSGTFQTGKTQYLYAGEGEDGISHLYYVLQSRIPQRCKTFAIPVKKNTQYCVKSFNSAYTDIKISLGFLTAPGTITPAVTSCSPLPQKSIPGNETFNENTEQWINLVSSHWRNTSHFQVAVDARPLLYKYCESFATLKAGTYKVMCDVWGNNRFSGSGGWWTGISQYRGNVNDNFDDTGASTNEWFALIAEDNTQIIQKTEIIPTGTTRNQPISYGAPYPNYWHKEVTFTLAADTKVGLMHSAYYSSNSDPNYAYFRFMIVDSDVEAVEFTTTNADPCDMTGYSAWEPYTVTLSVSVSSPGGGVRNYDINIDDYLTAGQSISLQDTGIIIETWYGRNTLDSDSDIPPVWYAKYYEGQEINMWAEQRPAQINIYDIFEPQNGFDHNGIAILMPSEVISDKEDGGRWDINMIHPIDEYGKWSYIVGQNTVKVNGQLFRIDETEINIDADSEYIQAHAKHITYDMSDYWIEEASIEASDGVDYVTKLSAAKVHDFPNQQHIVGEYVFDVRSDLDGPIKQEVKDESMIAALFGNDDSLAVRYGGQLYRDNFHMSVYKAMENAPSGLAFDIRYKKELTKISFRIDFSEWITNLICVDNFGSLFAVWYDTSGDWIVHHHKTKRVHFTYAELVDPDYAIERLGKDAMNLWADVNTPKISIKVEVANIKDDPAYKDFLNLQNYDVGYRGKVHVEHLGIDVEMKIVSIRRNELTGEAISITLGNTRNSLIRSTVMSQTVSSGNSIADKQAATIEALRQETSSAIESLNERVSELETEYVEIEGTSPMVFTGTGEVLSDYIIYGAQGGVGEQTQEGYVIPVSISAPGETTITVDIPITAPLGENETITYSQAEVDIPTFDGETVITIGTAVPPDKIYIKYRVPDNSVEEVNNNE